MRFVVHNPLAPPRLRSPAPKALYESMHRAADGRRAAFERSILGELRTLRAGVDTAALVSALASQRQDQAEAVVDWTSFQQRAATALAPLLQGLAAAGGRAAAEAMMRRARVAKAADDPPGQLKTLATWMIFRADLPEAERRALEEAGLLIQGITDESIKVVRETIAMYIRDGVDYGRGAQRIKDAVGLTRQAAGAVERYRGALALGTLAPARIEQLVATYAEKLLKLRAETISRTETIAAVNKGQLDYWEQLVAAGAVERGKAMKRWIVTPDDRLCPVCRDVLDGQTVGLNDKFHSPYGPVDHPPAHPNCRCAVNLLPDGV